MSLQKSFITILLALSIPVLAAPEKVEDESTTQLRTEEAITAAKGQPGAKLLGTLDIRPTVALKGQDSFRSEDSVELGYRFNPSFQLLYHQDFWTNLYNSSLVGGAEGVGLIVHDGYFDWFSDRVWESQDKSLFVSYEGRLYAPTFASRREAGMITALRNYLIVGKKVNETVSVNFVETPIVHVYDRASHLGKANPALENRMTLELALSLTSKIGLSLPFSWSAMQMRAVEGSSGGNKIESFVWINPELSYNLNNNYLVGVGYFDTTSLVKTDFSSLQIFEGLEDGVVQMFLRASL
jgi:hypothetical protein